MKTDEFIIPEYCHGDASGCGCGDSEGRGCVYGICHFSRDGDGSGCGYGDSNGFGFGDGDGEWEDPNYEGD